MKEQAMRTARVRKSVLVLLALGALAVSALAIAGQGSAASQASKSPITVMMINPVNATAGTNYPAGNEVAKVFEKWINAKGGILGRPLKVLFCDPVNDVNATRACARRVVDEKVVACVSCFSLYGTEIPPILEPANIADFGSCCPSGAANFTSRISFPLGGGVTVGIGATVAAARLPQCTKTALAIGDFPSRPFGELLADNAMKHFNKSLLRKVAVPLAAGDYSSQAAQVASGADCLVLILSHDQLGSFLPALRNTGTKARIFGVQGNLSDDVLKASPALAEGAVVAGIYPDFNDPRLADYRAALKKYKANPNFHYSGLQETGAWAAFKAFVAVITQAKLKTVTAQTFFDAANNTTNLNIGILPRMNLKYEWKGFPGFPRVFNRTVTFQTIKNGKTVPLDTKFHDVTYGLTGR